MYMCVSVCMYTRVNVCEFMYVCVLFVYMCVLHVCSIHACQYIMCMVYIHCTYIYEIRETTGILSID